MADLKFEREVRTPHSEAYLIMEQDRQVGRVDIHFTPEMVHAAVSVDESLTQETVADHRHSGRRHRRLRWNKPWEFRGTHLPGP